jgi:tRNA threonylcarbamoyladenosine modification (KEOPS) complex  Pcc1 subunit
MKTEIEIPCKEPDKIIRSLKPDIDHNEKFDINIKKNKDGIKITIESKEISGSLAAINSYLKMVKTLKDLEEIK